MLLAVALIACLALGAACFTFERAVNMLLDREDFSDVRFHAYAYPGQACENLRVESSASRGLVTIKNVGERPLTDLRITLKFFSNTARPVFERHVPLLEPGVTLTYSERDPDLGLDERVTTDLGMLYARVRCDQGVALARGWWSYWS
jgi:hypothetical protein